MRDLVLGSAPFFQRGLLDDIVYAADDQHLPQQHTLVPSTSAQPGLLDATARNLDKLLDDSAAPVLGELDLLHPGPFWTRVERLAQTLAQASHTHREIAAAVAMLDAKVGMNAMLSAYRNSLLQA